MHRNYANTLESGLQGGNSSLVVCWAHCPAWYGVVGSNLVWGEFFRRGDFLLELAWVRTQFPKNSFE